MKVALCFYGQPRFLNNPHAIASQRHFIMDRYDTDVFCHYWFDPKDKRYANSNFEKAGGCSAQYGYKNYVLENTVEIINERYSPKAYLCEKPQIFPEPDPLPDFCKNTPAYSKTNISNFLSQLYSWQKVVELASSQSDFENYDFVILTRYDLIFKAFPNLVDGMKRLTSAHPTYDFAITQPKFCEGIKPFDDFSDIAKEVTEFDVARFKKIAFTRKRSATYENHGWFFGLARSDTDDTMGGDGGDEFRLIAHRGNYKGPNPKLENTMNHIEEAFANGYEAEIDVWYKDGEFFSGHDKPDGPLNLEFLLREKHRLWIHCKNLDAMQQLWKYKNELNMFWHENDKVTLTTQNYVWTYPNQQLVHKSICALPELGHQSMEHCVGICSDNLEKFKC
jgi:hypothetical protein